MFITAMDLQYPPSSLMGLPAELRVVIFEYVLGDEQIHLRHRQSDDVFQRPIRWNGTALLAINAKTRREARHIFLDSAVFQFHAGFDEQDLRRWLDTVGGENIAQLRTLEFRCIGRCSMYGLQPDTDYCHRSATLIRGGPVHSTSAVRMENVDMCSNRAFGCLEMGRAALESVANRINSSPLSDGPLLTTGSLLGLWTVMTDDRSSSAA